MKKNRFDGKTCYMCDAQATSDEHVPPKCLFPEKKDLRLGEDLRVNLIKVPACSAHNTEKSGDDTYLLYVLSASITGNQTAGQHFLSKVIRSIKRKPALMIQLATGQKPIALREAITGESAETAAYQLDKERLNHCLDSIGRALYFHHFGKKWNGVIEATPNFIRTLSDDDSLFLMLEMMTESMFSGLPKYGSNSQVFSYQVKVEEGEGPVKLAMLLSFYGSTRATLLFK